VQFVNETIIFFPKKTHDFLSGPTFLTAIPLDALKQPRILFKALHTGSRTARYGAARHRAVRRRRRRFHAALLRMHRSDAPQRAAPRRTVTHRIRCELTFSLPRVDEK